MLNMIWPHNIAITETDMQKVNDSMVVFQNLWMKGLMVCSETWENMKVRTDLWATWILYSTETHTIPCLLFCPSRFGHHYSQIVQIFHLRATSPEVLMRWWPLSVASLLLCWRLGRRPYEIGYSASTSWSLLCRLKLGITSQAHQEGTSTCRFSG